MLDRLLDVPQAGLALVIISAGFGLAAVPATAAIIGALPAAE